MGTNVGRRSNRSVRSHRKVKHPVDPQATYPTFSIGQDVPTPTIITAPVSPYGVYAKYIGRVGALAVALGVGVAVATGFGIGIAKADDGGAAGNSAATDTAAARQRRRRLIRAHRMIRSLRRRRPAASPTVPHPTRTPTTRPTPA